MMTLKEYNAELTILEEGFEKEKKKLANRVAISNRKYKIGDILKEYGRIILVDTIKWTFNYSGNRLPCSVYEGLVLKKDLTPMKKPQRGIIYNEDAEKLN